MKQYENEFSLQLRQNEDMYLKILSNSKKYLIEKL